jgi:four helix bundle protein
MSDHDISLQGFDNAATSGDLSPAESPSNADSSGAAGSEGSKSGTQWRGNNRYWNLRKRVMDFALRIIKVYTALPTTTVAQVLGRQLLRSGTSVGAHFVEGHRAKSTADFVSKLEGAMQELEESLYWLELLVRDGIFAESRMMPLASEANQLLAIFVSIVKTSKSRPRKASKKTKR